MTLDPLCLAAGVVVGVLFWVCFEPYFSRRGRR